MLEKSIVRIRDKNGAVFGVGFVLEGKRVMTCAHVVAAVLNTENPSDEPPRGEITLDFPLVAPGSMLTSNVTKWYPPREHANPEPEDIALLTINGELPPGVIPIRLREANDLFEHKFWAFGFPRLAPDVEGRWVRGTILGRQERQWVQINPSTAGDDFVSRGYSGAPVWDTQSKGVVGMVVAVEEVVTSVDSPDQEGVTEMVEPARVGWFIPTDQLQVLLKDDIGRTLPPWYPPALGNSCDEEWYVHREIEEIEARGNLANGVPVLLFGSTNFGKSSLMDHLQREWLKDATKDQPRRTININLRQFEERCLVSLDACAKELVRQMLKQAGKPDTLAPEDWDSDSSAIRNTTRLVEQRILGKQKGQVMLVLEKMDQLSEHEFVGDFAGMLRSWYLESRNGPTSPWSRLLLLLEVNTTPMLLIKHPNKLNVVAPIELNDLRIPQVRQLSLKYGLNWVDTEIRRLMDWVGGHPYLLRIVMWRAVMLDQSLNEVLKNAYTTAGVFKDHLRELRNTFLADEELMDAACRILDHPREPEYSITFQRLIDAGLVIEPKPGYFCPRYRLYEKFMGGLCRLRKSSRPAGH